MGGILERSLALSVYDGTQRIAKCTFSVRHFDSLIENAAPFHSASIHDARTGAVDRTSPYFAPAVERTLPGALQLGAGPLTRAYEQGLDKLAYSGLCSDNKCSQAGQGA
jgi:hypothetical protein